MIEKITGEYDRWVRIKNMAENIKIEDNVQVMSCDTRDFAMGWQFEQPKISNYHNDIYNEGIKNLLNLYRVSNRDKYIIPKTNIIKWLTDLCEKTGGTALEWRYVEAKVRHCENWALKYIRFVRDIENSDNFIVCNSYMQPIHWKEIIPKLNKRRL